jgi:hypothetical protein
MGDPTLPLTHAIGPANRKAGKNGAIEAATGGDCGTECIRTESNPTGAGARDRRHSGISTTTSR